MNINGWTQVSVVSSPTFFLTKLGVQDRIRLCRSSLEAAIVQGRRGGRKIKAMGVEEWVDIHKFECDSKTKDTEGTIDAMPHWAGESVEEVRGVQSAADILAELLSEAEKLSRAPSSLAS